MARILRTFVPMRRIVYLLLGALMMAACGNDEEFVVKARVEGLGDKGVEMIYYNNGLRRVTFHPVKGELTLTGTSAVPVPVEVVTVDGDPLFTVIASNGDEIEVQASVSDPAKFQAKGNRESAAYAAFVAANDSLLRGDDAARINALIARLVRENPQGISSALVMMNYFRAPGYELLADSLINDLVPEARSFALMRSFSSGVGEQVSTSARGPLRSLVITNGLTSGRDTTLRYNASNSGLTLLVITGNIPKADSLTSVMRRLARKLPRRRFRLLEVTLGGDSAGWRRSVARDSSAWLQGWLPGGTGATPVRPLQLPRLPYFLVLDSTGTQLYRGAGFTAATDTITRRLSAYLKDPSAESADTIPAN